jgi:hypothetical protein
MNTRLARNLIALLAVSFLFIVSLATSSAQQPTVTPSPTPTEIKVTHVIFNHNMDDPKQGAIAVWARTARVSGKQPPDARHRRRLQPPKRAFACMTSARERFERELARSRYLGRFVVVVEGGLPDVLAARRQMSEASVIGTLAAWQRRYTGFFFAGSVKVAAEFSFRFLAGQMAEIQKLRRKLSL